MVRRLRELTISSILTSITAQNTSIVPLNPKAGNRLPAVAEQNADSAGRYGKRHGDTPLHRVGRLTENEPELQRVDDRERQAHHGVGDKQHPVVVGQQHRQRSDADEHESAACHRPDRCGIADPSGDDAPASIARNTPVFTNPMSVAFTPVRIRCS